MSDRALDVAERAGGADGGADAADRQPDERAPLSAADAAALVLRALDADAPAAVATVLPDGSGPVRRLVLVGGSLAGGLGDPALDAAVEPLLRAALDDTAADAAELRAIDVADGSRRVLIETHRPAPRLVVVGAGHIAVPLAALGARLGMDVTVLDDREAFASAGRFADGVAVRRVDFERDPFAGLRLRDAFVVLVTRAHRYDFDCLRLLLADAEAAPAYIGMIGSRRRVRAAFHALREAGVPESRLRAVHAPVGLEIGAETPAEIAVSIMAEIIAVRRDALDAGGGPISARERVAERFGPGAADA